MKKVYVGYELLRAGQRIPWWRGTAYFDYARDAAITYPIPINLIVGLSLRLWWWLQLVLVHKDRELYRKAFERGFLAGLKQKTWEGEALPSAKEWK